MMDLHAATAAMSGALIGENANFSSVSTDSRAVAAGQLFIALRGESFDGHDFIASAMEQGAVAAVVDTKAAPSLNGFGLPLIVVADTRLALGQLAAGWRARFSIPVIAVTGSNGKTTSKEMIASILRAAFDNQPDTVLATQGNLNNDIGLPLTLLKLNAGHRAAVIEMGMNHPGEIAYLTGITRPNVAIVTNAQRAHLAGMGSLEAIASEKGSIFMGLNKQGVAVINADDQWAGLWRGLTADHQVMSYSFERAADITGVCVVRGLENHLTISTAGQQLEVVLALPGLHNARNALGAAAATLAAGVSLEAVRDGLNNFRGIKGRLQQLSGLNGAVLLDDSYNANPDSVRAGIDVLAATVGKKVLVLGDMGEIGEMTGQFHDEVGGYAKSQGVDLLFAFGESSALTVHNFGAGGQHFKKIEDLIEALSSALTPQTTVLIKGSRFMRMERVVDALKEINADQASDVKGEKSCC
ncbi:MAG: UDP-N-acetylmuramoyl-tripeptide--D-alanyl-D-alanine ligase [Betaproteobacteria bacterium]